MNVLFFGWLSMSYRDLQTTDWWWLHSASDAKYVPGHLSQVDKGVSIPHGVYDEF